MVLNRIALSVSKTFFELPSRVRKIILVSYIVHRRIGGTHDLPPPPSPANSFATPFTRPHCCGCTTQPCSLHCMNLLDRHASVSHIESYIRACTILENCSLIPYLVHSFRKFYNYYVQRSAARLSPLCYTVHLLRRTLLSYYTCCSLSFACINPCLSS